MKNYKTLSLIIILSTLFLSGCSSILSEKKASENLLENIEKNYYGVVQSKSTSKMHNFDLSIDSVSVGFHEPEKFSDSHIVLSGHITINDSIVKNNYISMMFSARSILDIEKNSIRLTDSNLIDLDLHSVYSAYYVDFEKSLKNYVNEVVGYNISNSSVYSIPSERKGKDLTLTMSSSDNSLIIEAKSNK